MRYISKRDGRKVEYSFEKILKAVNKAFNSCNQETPEKFAEQLKDEFEKVWAKAEKKNLEPEPMSIETVQDTIENFLILKNKKEVARAYIRYRDKRDRVRQQNSKLHKSIKEKLEARNIQNQNANVDEASFGGRMGEAARVVTKEMALDYGMTEMSRNNHINNEIYIHDLDNYALGNHNCLTIPFDDLLKKGFTTRQTDVRPANSVNTALQLVAVIFQLQSLQQFGGVAASHIDWTMVPYVKKSFRKHLRDFYEDVKGNSREDAENILTKFEENYGEIKFGNEDLKNYDKEAYNFAFKQTEKEVYQAVEGMYHNLNTLQSRSGKIDCSLVA